MYGCGAGGGSILLSDLVIDGNINTDSYYGSGALWLYYLNSVITIQRVVFESNQDSRALDLAVQTYGDSTVRLINNVHVTPSTGSSVVGVPPVIQVLASCDEVSRGHRGLIGGETTPKTYWLQDPSDGSQMVQTRCSFVPKGGLEKLHLAAENPLDYPVEGWNVIARRQWQDDVDFARTWEECVMLLFFFLAFCFFSSPRHLCAHVSLFSSSSFSFLSISFSLFFFFPPLVLDNSFLLSLCSFFPLLRYKNGFGDLATAFWMGNERLA
jgi:hypothetical protein